ncbi:MAG: DUF2339 domain-containing protein [Planctomycetes bacterium]|nr:DUF2339 domain-containing protein [Planctomycetota bacterium]
MDPSPEDRHRELQRRVEELERRIADLERTGSPGARVPEASPPGETPRTTEPPPSGRRFQPWRGRRADPGREKPPRPDLESLIGGSLLQRLGLAAIFLGFAFLLKLSFERGWISPSLRVASGFAAGLGLVLGGEVARRRAYSRFGAGLTGGGIALLYLTVYAGHAFYGFFGDPLAFALSAGVTLGGVLLALRWGSLPLAVLAQLGGFFTPVMLDTGMDRQVALMTFLLVLDAGLVVVSWRKGWRLTEWIGWAGTALLFQAWTERHYDGTKLVPTLRFLSLFYAVFLAAPVARAFSRGRVDGVQDLAGMLLPTSLYAPAALWLLGPDRDLAASLLSFTLAAAFAGMGLAFGRRAAREPELARFPAILFGLGGLLFTEGLARGFEDATLTVLLAAWAAVVGGLAARTNLPLVRLGAVLLHGWVISRGLVFHHWFDYRPSRAPWIPFWNERVSTWTAAGAALVAAALCAHFLGRTRRGRVPVSWLLGTLWMALAVGSEFAGLASHADGRAPWVVMSFAAPIGGYLPFANARCVFWIAAAAVFWLSARGLAGLRGRSDAFGRGLDHAAWMVGVVILASESAGLLDRPVGANPARFFALSLEVADWRFLANGRAVLLAVYAAGILLSPAVDRRFSRGPSPGWHLAATKSVGVAVLLALLSGETVGLAVEAAARSPWDLLLEARFLGTAAQTALTLTWGGAAMGILAIGIARGDAVLRRFGLVVFGATIVKILFVDLSQVDLVYRIFSFLGTGMVLVAASWAYHRYVIGPEKRPASA